MTRSTVSLAILLVLLGGFLFLLLDPFHWSHSPPPAGAASQSSAARVPPAADDPAAAARSQRTTEDLLVDVAPPPTLRGRVVTRSDARPLAGAWLSAMVRSPDSESPELLADQADDEGRFELRRKSERISTLDLHLGGGFHQSPSILVLDGSELPADGDLGDVSVADVREVQILVRSREGEPIRGATAVAGGTRSAPTGEDGRCMLRWVPLAVTLLRAEAAGFVPTEVGLAPTLPDPLVIELEPASLLVVRVIPLAGGDPGQFRVVLRCENGVAGGPIRDQVDQAMYVDVWSPPPDDLMQEPLALFLAGQPSGPEGLVRFRALRVGAPLQLEVRGMTGTEVRHRRTLESFQPGEARRIEVALD